MCEVSGLSSTNTMASSLRGVPSPLPAARRQPQRQCHSHRRPQYHWPSRLGRKRATRPPRVDSLQLQRCLEAFRAPHQRSRRGRQHPVLLLLEPILSRKGFPEPHQPQLHLVLSVRNPQPLRSLHRLKQMMVTQPPQKRLPPRPRHLSVASANPHSRLLQGSRLRLHSDWDPLHPHRRLALQSLGALPERLRSRLRRSLPSAVSSAAHLQPLVHANRSFDPPAAHVNDSKVDRQWKVDRRYANVIHQRTQEVTLFAITCEKMFVCCFSTM